MRTLGLWAILYGCQESSPLPMVEQPKIYPASNNNRVKARHILLSYEGAWRANSRRGKDDALRQIQAYRDQIMTGVDFGWIAQQYSEDPQKKDQGGLGVIEPGQMVPEFETALFMLQINEISDIVETGFGYHIIQRLPLDERMLIHIAVADEETRDTVQAALLNGTDPRSLAVQYSTGAHGIRGGELGWFERTDLDTTFVEPVFNLDIGTCTNAIKRQDEWHFFCRQG